MTNLHVKFASVEQMKRHMTTMDNPDPTDSTALDHPRYSSLDPAAFVLPVAAI